MGSIKYDGRLELRNVTLSLVCVEKEKASRPNSVVSCEPYYSRKWGARGLPDRGAFRKFSIEEEDKVSIFAFVPWSRSLAKAYEEKLFIRESRVKHAGYNNLYHTSLIGVCQILETTGNVRNRGHRVGALPLAKSGKLTAFNQESMIYENKGMSPCNTEIERSCTDDFSDERQPPSMSDGKLSRWHSMDMFVIKSWRLATTMEVIRKATSVINKFTASSRMLPPNQYPVAPQLLIFEEDCKR